MNYMKTYIAMGIYYIIVKVIITCKYEYFIFMCILGRRIWS